MEQVMGVPWTHAIMQRDHNLSLQFADGWVHGRVKNMELTQADYDLADQLAAGSADYTVNSGSSGTYWWQWKDSNNYDYLHEETTNTILQAFVGIWPYRLRHWFRWPQMTPGRLDKIVVKSVPDKDTIGYQNGIPDVGSPYECPTNLTEVFIPPKQTLEHGLFNPEAYAVKPAFKLIINRMRMEMFDPESSEGRSEISKIATGRVPTKKWTPGMQLWEYNVGTNLGIDPIPAWEDGALNKPTTARRL